MAFADLIRSAIATWEDVADLIEGIFTSSYPLAYTTWVPSYGAGGSMTYTSVTTTYARYWQCGDHGECTIYARGTTGGSASAYLTVTLPFTSAALTDQTFPIAIEENGTASIGKIVIPTGSSTARIYKADNSNWGLGSNRYFFGKFSLETA